MTIRREVARSYGCMPGSSVNVVCKGCTAKGRIDWVMGVSGRGQGQVVFQGMELDHVTPESAGGATASHNLQLLCRPCNRRKGAR